MDDKPEFIKANENSVIIAKVEVMENMGSETCLYLLYNNKSLAARVESPAMAKIDESIKIAIDMNKMHLFGPITELAIV